MARLEIVTTCLEDAENAEQGGAHSVEIALELLAHGITPPRWLVEEIRKAVEIDVHVILRPHDSGFVYDSSDIAHVLDNARMLADMGIEGIVFGAHTPEGDFDIDLIQRVHTSAPNLKLTVHRAIDTCRNPVEALTELRGVARRVLASGGAANAWDGRHTLRGWIQRFGADFEFVAGGGITKETAAEIARVTRAPMIHVGSAAREGAFVSVDKVRALAESVEHA